MLGSTEGALGALSGAPASPGPLFQWLGGPTCIVHSGNVQTKSITTASFPGFFMSQHIFISNLYHFS